MNATEIAATLSVRAADVCRRYLPRGRKQGRYWTVGDTNGAKGRSLFVRLAFQGIPEKWTGAATNKHGYLLDLIRLRTGGASLRRAMEEALAFLSLPPSTPDNGGGTEGVQRSWLDPKRPAKAKLARPRKALGRVHGRAVRFGGSATPARPCLPARASKPFYRWLPPYPRHSCRGGSIGGQPWRLRTTPRPLPVGHRPR